MNIRIFARVLALLLIVCVCVPMPVRADGDEAAPEAMVQNITVKDGYFETDFDPNVFYYDVYLNNYSYDLFVSVELTDPRFEYTVTGADTITNSSSGNPVTVSVYDPQGEYETVEYCLTVFVGINNDDVIRWQGLSYLDVEHGVFSPQFTRYRTVFYAILENNVDSFEAAGVNYRLTHPDAAVEIECRDELNEDGTLPEGKRVQYAIKVTEADGTSKTYHLYLYRKAMETAAVDDDAKLEGITINGGAVALSGFSSHRASYEVSVPKTVTKLDIQAYAEDKSQIVRVIGPTTMNADGPVFVSILVESTQSDAFSVYTLRLEYDSFMHTQRYSSFQMLSYILLTGAVCLCAGIFAGRHSKRKGRYTAKKPEGSQKV